VIKQTLKAFHSQLEEYFGNLNTAELLPSLGESDGMSSNTPNSYLIPRSSSSAFEQEDAFVLRYINHLLSNERLLFCPLVREFLRFDMGKNIKSRSNTFDEMLLQSLNCRRAQSFWKQDPSISPSKKEKIQKETGLLGLKRSFYFQEALTENEIALNTHLNFEYMMKSDYIAKTPE